jgi:hypothetical protein
MRTHALLTVVILDVNDNTPVFTPADHHRCETTVDEDIADLPAVVLTPKASDADSGANG